jgi:hypothetical protein
MLILTLDSARVASDSILIASTNRPLGADGDLKTVNIRRLVSKNERNRRRERWIPPTREQRQGLLLTWRHNPVPHIKAERGRRPFLLRDCRPVQSQILGPCTRRDRSRRRLRSCNHQSGRLRRSILRCLNPRRPVAALSGRLRRHRALPRCRPACNLRRRLKPARQTRATPVSL